MSHWLSRLLPDDAFLLSEPHVTAMFQCLEAVEQNNPKLLAQVDTVGVGGLKPRDAQSTSVCVSFPCQRSLLAGQLSPLKSSPVLGLLKSQSLCVLPGAGGAWRSADSAVRGEALNRRLTMSNCSLREAVCTGHDSGDATGAGSHSHIGTSEEDPSFLPRVRAGLAV